jgi:hypothetical protein
MNFGYSEAQSKCSTLRRGGLSILLFGVAARARFTATEPCFREVRFFTSFHIGQYRFSSGWCVVFVTFASLSSASEARTVVPSGANKQDC